MPVKFVESEVEEAALSWFEELGYSVLFGPDMAPGELFSERASYQDVILERRLREAIARLNPELPAEAHEEAFRKVMLSDSPSLVARNRAFHRMLVDGVGVEYSTPEGSIAGAQAQAHRLRRPRQQRLAGREPVHRDRGAARQAPRHRACSSTACRWPSSSSRTRPTRTPRSGRPSTSSRPTSSRFRRSSRSTSCWSSPTACRRASARSPPTRSGSCPGAPSRATRWPPQRLPSCGVLIKGVFEQERLARAAPILHRLRGHGDRRSSPRRWPGYHQFHAVNVAWRAAATRRRVRVPGATDDPDGDRRPARRRGLAHPGLGQEPDDGVLRRAHRPRTRRWRTRPSWSLTDRNDLDDQLFGTFARCQDLLRQTPVQAAEPGRPAREALQRGLGRRGLHHHPEVLPRGDGRPAAGCSPTGATSWSSPTRPTAASTTSSTASPGTCATPCRTPRSSASPARRSS